MSTEEERKQADLDLDHLAKVASNGHQSAEHYLLHLSFVSRQLDDMVDKDHTVTDENLVQAFFTIYSGYQGNAFYNQMRLQLEPVQVLIFNAWLDGDEQRAQNRIPLSVVLGEMIMEAYIYVAYLTGGFNLMRQVSRLVRDDTQKLLIAEDFTDGQ